MKKWLGIFCFLLCSLTQAAIVAGKDYTVLPKAHAVSVPSKIEVLEFFSYDCIHCYRLEPVMQAFQQKLPVDVNVRKVQVMWGKSREGFAKLYATLQVTGYAKALHRPVFDAVMGQRINLNDVKVLTPWLQKQKGIDTKKFMSVYNSFGVNAEVAKYTQLTKEYAIDGTPAVIVEGKYQVKPASPEQMVQVTSELIEKVRKEKQSSVAGKSSTKSTK